MTQELKPCPMCAGEAYITEGFCAGAQWPGEFHRVYCGTCQLRQLFHKTPSEAVTAWNRRALAAPLANPSDKQEADGWKLVPIRPTDKMTAIGQDLRYQSVWSIGAIYREMIDAAPLAQSAEQDRIDAERHDAICRKALAMGDGPDTMGPDTHEHNFEVEPSSGIELCTYCRLSRVAAKGASK